MKFLIDNCITVPGKLKHKKIMNGSQSSWKSMWQYQVSNECSEWLIMKTNFHYQPVFSAFVGKQCSVLIDPNSKVFHLLLWSLKSLIISTLDVLRQNFCRLAYCFIRVLRSLWGGRVEKLVFYPQESWDSCEFLRLIYHSKNYRYNRGFYFF